MSRISIDVTAGEHKKLKAMAALNGQSIKDFVLDRTLKTGDEEDALRELENILDERIEAARKGAVSRKSVSQIVAETLRKRAR